MKIIIGPNTIPSGIHAIFQRFFGEGDYHLTKYPKAIFQIQMIEYFCRVIPNNLIFYKIQRNKWSQAYRFEKSTPIQELNSQDSLHIYKTKIQLSSLQCGTKSIGNLLRVLFFCYELIENDKGI